MTRAGDDRDRPCPDRAGDRAGAGRRRAAVRRPGAVDRSPARRRPRAARQLDVLLPARHLDRGQHRAHVDPLADRAPLRRAVGAVGLAVLLALGVAGAAEVRGVDMDVSALGGCVRCPARPRRATTVRATLAGDAVEVNGARAAGFRLRSDGPVLLNGREYPAPLDIVRSGEGLAVVNELPLEEYLVGVLRAEGGEKWPLEALRAQ